MCDRYIVEELTHSSSAGVDYRMELRARPDFNKAVSLGGSGRDVRSREEASLIDLEAKSMVEPTVFGNSRACLCIGEKGVWSIDASFILASYIP